MQQKLKYFAVVSLTATSEALKLLDHFATDANTHPMPDALSCVAPKKWHSHSIGCICPEGEIPSTTGNGCIVEQTCPVPDECQGNKYWHSFDLGCICPPAMIEGTDHYCTPEDVLPQQCDQMKVWDQYRGECVCEPPAFDNGNGGCTIDNHPECDFDKYWHNNDLGCICS